jgi:hypothetical protein
MHMLDVRHAVLIDLATMRIGHHLVKLLDTGLVPTSMQARKVGHFAQCPGVPLAAIRAISSISVVVSRAILSQFSWQAASRALVGARSCSSSFFHRARW